MSKHIRRTVKQTEQLIAQISELEWKGYTQAKIAEKVGASQQMVSHYLRQIEAEVQRRLVPDRVVARQKQLDKVRSLMSTIWDDIDEDIEELRKHPESRSRVKAAIAAARRSALQSLEVENRLIGLYEKFDPTSTLSDDDLSHCSETELAERWSQAMQQTTQDGATQSNPSIDEQSTEEDDD